MHIRTTLLTTAISIGLGALLAPTALAGSAVIQSEDGSSSTFEYNSSALRVISGDYDNYTIVRDGTIYSVVQQDGRTIVIDAGKVMKDFGSAAAAAAPGDLSAKVVSLDKTNRTEVVAGIKGDVYELRVVDKDGQEQTDEIVLSTDRRAREFRDALFMMVEVTANLTANTPTNGAQDIWKRLQGLNAGVLRYGRDLVITSISDEKIADSRFELPAEPMDMNGMMGAGSGPDGGDGGQGPGVFSSVVGAMGGSVGIKSSSGSAAVNVGEGTAKKVDNAVGKAWGKLFGKKKTTEE